MAKGIPRKNIGRRIEPLTELNYRWGHLDSARAAAQRAFVDWRAIGTRMGRQRFPGAPEVWVDSFGEVAILLDDGSLTLANGELNYLAVWDHFRRAYGDQLDFVTFFADFSVPFGFSFWSAIYLNTRGISPHALPHDLREDWSTSRLQGFHFVHPSHVNLMGVHLRVFAHQWGPGVYFAESPRSDFVFANLLRDGEPGYWDVFVDDAHSPMNHEFLFTPYMCTHWKQRDEDPALFDHHWGEGIEYCDLDLYLMGLLPPESAKPFYFIGNPRQVGPRTWKGERSDVTVEMVINAMGPRASPPGLPVNEFRDAWVLVTRDARQGLRTASRLDDIRQDFEMRYHAATRYLARVDTSLPPRLQASFS